MRRISVLLGLLFVAACGSSNPTEPTTTTGQSSKTTGATSSGGTTSAGNGNSTSTQTVPSGTPAYWFQGRWDTTDPNAAISVWPSAAVTAQFQATAGTNVAVTLSDPMTYTYPINGSNVVIDNYVDIYVDNANTPLTIGPLTSTPTSYPIVPSKTFASLSAGVHTVTVSKRTDARVGPLLFSGYTFGSGGKLVAPPALPAHKVEFIGASGSAGYGDLGNGLTTQCHFTPDLEDADLSYPRVTAQTLGADFFNISFTGKGVYRNIYPSSDALTMPLLYPTENPDRYKTTWDFTKWVPDEVVIDLGANDFDVEEASEQQLDSSNPSGVAAFESAYESFIGTIHKNYPNAKVTVLVEADFTADQKSYLQAVVQSFGGASWVEAFELPPFVTSVVGLGCDAHPSVAGHAQSAAALAAHLKTWLKW